MPAISTHTLSSGMPLVLESMPGVRSVGLTWLVPAGSATDPADRQGLSAMWAELLLRGAADLDSRAQADAMDRLGVSRSCDVSTQHLRLSATLLGSRLLEALPLIVDMVRRPRVDMDAVEPTRDLALQALDALKDDPQERAVLEVRRRHNPSPLNRSGLGTPEGLAAITRDDLLSFWAGRARPVGSILAIAGDLDAAGGPGAIASELDGLLAGWSGNAPRAAPEHAPHKGAFHHVIDPSAQVQVVLMHDAPAEPSPSSILEKITFNVLSGGMSSRLFTEVREKRALCYSVSASYATDRDYGRGLAYVGTTPERAQESLCVLLAELRRINSPAGAVTREEFDRALIGIKSSLIFSGESTGARSGALAGDLYRLGRPRSLDEMVAEYERVSLDALNSYLAARDLGSITIVTLGPTPLTTPE